MMSEVEIDVRPYRNSENTLRNSVVGVLLVIGVTLSAAGVQHKREKAKASVSWHNVSDTLQQVELAKSDLFATLRDKSQ